jgi:hypothetical protein
MFDKLTNSQALLRSEEKRWTEFWWEIFIWHGMFDELRNLQGLLRSEEKRWTEFWWEIFIRHVMFHQLRNSQTLLQSERDNENNIINMRNIHLACVVRWVDKLESSASKWAGEVKIVSFVLLSSDAILVYMNCFVVVTTC